MGNENSVALFDPSCGNFGNDALRNMKDFTVIPIISGAGSDPLNMRSDNDCTIDINREIEVQADANPGVDAFGCPDGFEFDFE